MKIFNEILKSITVFVALSLSSHLALSAPESPVAPEKSVQNKPVSQLGKMPNPYQTMVVNNNLSLRQFMAAVSSQSHEERHYGEMYLLGVLDTTEGSEWCGYSFILPDSAASIVYTNAEKLVKTRGDERASAVIRQILRDQLTCRSKK